MIAPLVEVRNLVKHFASRRWLPGRAASVTRAVDGVSFAIARGETLALVGESGCGKSTTGRCVLRLIEPTAGEIRLDGTDLVALDRAAMRPMRRRIQIIFQDPGAALTSHLRVGEQIAEPLRNLAGITDAAERRTRVSGLLRRVGLSPADAERYPHEFSGGQRQRVCIARALAAGPDLIVCDEAVSALDVSIKAQIVNLLIDLQETEGVGYLFISHDMGVVAAISHRIAVMYLGRIVEMADTEALFADPRHPYTRALLQAVPVPRVGARAAAARATLAEPAGVAESDSAGCRYRDRCPLADARCARDEPPLSIGAGGHAVACHHV
ncbi:ABC transporter ATP-binding protein [Elioraea sp.]|uniref:ABC transporter ATP-binding protein n=1 Tax=Elioraea sp. TaxID=2185103 RepID=UPI003F716A0C